MRRPFWSIVLLLMLPSRATFAGQGTITGNEPKGWDTGYYNVVVAVVRDIRKDGGGDPNRYQAHCLPKATLAGRLDPSLYPDLPVAFYTGRAVGATPDPPSDGALVIAVLQLEREGPAGAAASAFIFSDICTFMPGESAMVPIKSLADPRVAETLKKLQDARAHPNPDPYAKPPAKAPPRTPKPRD